MASHRKLLAPGNGDAKNPNYPAERLEGLQSNVRSLQRGLKILKLISRKSGIKAGEIAEQVGLARPTVYRLLETLEEEGYVVRSASDNRFRVTRQTQSLGIGYDAVNSISQIAGPVLVELSQRFIWPFDMSVCDGKHMVIQESTHPRSPLSVDRGVIGRRLPMLRTAAGRCFLAYSTPQDRAQIVQQVAQLADPEDNMCLTTSWLEKMCCETCERGYATRYHEQYNSHTSSIALPIFSGSLLVGSVAVIWITKAMTLEEGVDQFLDTMREATRRITHRHDHLHASA